MSTYDDWKTTEPDRYEREDNDDQGEEEPGCPKCGGELGTGYGLAGGGFGVYTYCTADGCDYFDKTQDPPEDGGPADDEGPGF